MSSRGHSFIRWCVRTSTPGSEPRAPAFINISADPRCGGRWCLCLGLSGFLLSLFSIYLAQVCRKPLATEPSLPRRPYSRSHLRVCLCARAPPAPCPLGTVGGGRVSTQTRKSLLGLVWGEGEVVPCCCAQSAAMLAAARQASSSLRQAFRPAVTQVRFERWEGCYYLVPASLCADSRALSSCSSGHSPLPLPMTRSLRCS